MKPLTCPYCGRVCARTLDPANPRHLEYPYTEYCDSCGPDLRFAVDRNGDGVAAPIIPCKRCGRQRILASKVGRGWCNACINGDQPDHEPDYEGMIQARLERRGEPSNWEP